MNKKDLKDVVETVKRKQLHFRDFMWFQRFFLMILPMDFKFKCFRSIKFQKMCFVLVLGGLACCMPLKYRKHSSAFYENGQIRYRYYFSPDSSRSVVREYDQNKILVREWHYKNKQLDGVTVEHDLQGRRQLYFYSRGVLLKKHIYTKNGKLSSTIAYENGLRNGKTFEYYPSGEVKQEWDYVRDTIIFAKGYFRSGRLRTDFSHYNFTHGKGTGTIVEYDENGQVSAEFLYAKGLRNGITKKYSEGKLKTTFNYVNDTLQGQSTTYNTQGQVASEFNYTNGAVNGITRQYADGQLKYEFLYVNNKLQGLSHEYDKSGRLSGDWNYDNGVLEGISKEYHRNGALLMTGRYHLGKKEGTFKKYDETGMLKNTWEYKDGLLDGFVKSFSPGGKIYYLWTYKAGKLHGDVAEYDDFGNVKYVWHYKNGKRK